ncbi:hypothetical protein HPB47_026543 [Ixodes persulcatus]|uniref:Uncharacterized protein n=1 Tax=Ixodes persulcatus TaxID=34615 RepID=A0AC60PYF0_IXOPE|nr:hypothetical protein HPB47_026543 [Ixodes persulcatus]
MVDYRGLRRACSRNGQEGTSDRPARHHVVTAVVSSATSLLAARRPACDVAAAPQPPIVRNGRRMPQPHSWPDTPDISSGIRTRQKRSPPGRLSQGRPQPLRSSTSPTSVCHRLRPSSSEKAVPQGAPVSEISWHAAATFGFPTYDFDDPDTSLSVTPVSLV